MTNRTRRLAAAMALVFALAVFGGPVVEPASAMAPVCKKSELCGGNDAPYVEP